MQNHYRRKTAALLTGLSVSVSQAASPTVAPDVAAPCEKHMKQMSELLKQHELARLDQLASVLRLLPEQQAAWQTYSKAELANVDPVPCPPAGAGAPQLARLRADRAVLIAQRLTASSKQLSTLWDALTPIQKKRFEEMVR